MGLKPFDRRKFKELMLYIAAKSVADETFGSTKLNKLLCNVDFRAYLELGAPVTGAKYQHLPQGPAARALVPVQEEMLDYDEAKIEVRRYYGKDQTRLVPMRDPDMSRFGQVEIELINDEIRGSWGKDASTMSFLAHISMRGWQLTADQQEIPYASAFLSPEPPSAEALALGQRIAREHNWL